MECYPLEISLLSARVDGLEPGLYYYDGANHSLAPGIRGDLRRTLFETTFNQTSILEAAGVLVISACYARSEPKLGESARDYVHMEVGHAGQNVQLQAEALGLGTVVIAAFRPGDAAAVLGLPEGQTPIYLMPFGSR
jgi:SagB-type dehydrogenase family enzyme